MSNIMLTSIPFCFHVGGILIHSMANSNQWSSGLFDCLNNKKDCKLFFELLVITFDHSYNNWKEIVTTFALGSYTDCHIIIYRFPFNLLLSFIRLYDS